jgi:solute carrier family 41
VVVGFLSSIVAILIGVVLPGEKSFNFQNALLLCASSLLTAAVASLILGFLMIMVIFFSRKININPDNVSTPIAGTVGDFTTLGILAYTASFLHSNSGNFY